jgi:hypothetical protein
MMYMAYVKYEQLNDKKLDPSTVFAIIGYSTRCILAKSEKYGTGSSIVGALIPMGPDWR